MSARSRVERQNSQVGTKKDKDDATSARGTSQKASSMLQQAGSAANSGIKKPQQQQFKHQHSKSRQLFDISQSISELKSGLGKHNSSSSELLGAKRKKKCRMKSAVWSHTMSQANLKQSLQLAKKTPAGLKKPGPSIAQTLEESSSQILSKPSKTTVSMTQKRSKSKKAGSITNATSISSSIVMSGKENSGSQQS